MDSVVIEHRQYGRYAISYLVVFGIFAMIFFFSDTPRGYIGGVYAVCAGLLTAAICILESRKSEIFSAEGICIKGIVKTRKIPWEQVIQVGIGIDCEGRANEHTTLAFTFAGGSPRKKNQSRRKWALENTPKTALSVPCSAELCELIIQCYGPLDFDVSE